MGLSCTLFGHDWGETQAVRDRTEEGEEVVVTEREFRNCRRCGAEELISENTEIRPVERNDPDTEPSNSPDTTPRYSPPDGVETQDGVILDESAGRDRGEWPDAETTDMEPSDDQTEILTDPAGQPSDTATETTTDDEDTPETEDGQTEILTDEVSEPASAESKGESSAEEATNHDDTQTELGADRSGNADAGRGEDATKDGVTTSDGQTEVLSDQSAGSDPQWDVDPEDLNAKDEGLDVDPSAEQTEVIGGGVETDVEGTPQRGGPESDAPDADAGPSRDRGEPSEDLTSGGWPGESSSDAEGTPSEPDSTLLTCEACGHQLPQSDTSLRAGDSCPACGRAYLAEE